MKLTFTIVALALAAQCVSALCAQLGSGHKSEAEIARMTPEQRVEEYCKEYVRHSYWHRAYDDLLEDSIMRDGLNGLPALVRIINEYDPTRREGRSRERNAGSYAAQGLLSMMDHNLVRLRAVDDGRTAVDALSRLCQRMKTAKFDTAEDEGESSRQARYEGTVSALKDLRGISDYDEAIRDSLALRYKIHLSDDDLLSFTNSLMAKDAYYPTWSKTETYKDRTRINKAGYPAQYLIVKDAEPFYKAYLQYKATANHVK